MEKNWRSRLGVDPDSVIPIPYPISFDLTFIEEEDFPTREAYDREVRKVIRSHLVPPSPDLHEVGPFREYNARLWKIIREVMAEC